MNLKSINIVTFCDLQGVSDIVRMPLTKQYRNSGEKSYENWYKIASVDYSVGDKKNFTKEKIEKTDKK